MSADSKPTGGKVATALNFGTFVGTTAAVVLLSWTVLDDLLPVRKSLHAFEVSSLSSSGNMAFPHSYPTLDWIMTPELDKDGLPNLVNVQANNCLQDANIIDRSIGSKRCAPEPWQTAAFCPEAGTTHAAWSTSSDAANALTGTAVGLANLEKQLAYDDAKKDLGPYPCESNGDKICYATPQVKDACKVERIGNFAVMANDASSWSLASGHNADLLYQGAAIILWLVSGFHIINRMYPVTLEDAKMAYTIENRFERQKMFKRGLGIVAALYFILLRSFFTSHDVVQGNTVYAHLMPNASYFYVLISIVWITIFGSMDSVFCHMQQIRAARGQGNSEEIAGLILPAGPVHNVPGDTAVPEFVPDFDPSAPPVKPENTVTAFNLSQFSSGKKLDAYLPRLAPKNNFPGTPDPKFYTKEAVISIDKFDFDYELLNNSCIKFEVAQLFTLPLLLLAISVRYNGWEIDSKLQILYLAGFGYALFDVARNRIHYTCKVFDQLLLPVKNGMPAAADADTADTKKTTSGQDSVKSAMRIMEFLCVFLQLLVFAVVFNTWLEHIHDRRASASSSPEDGRERHMDYSIYSFSMYAGVAFFLKLVQIWAATSKTRWVLNKNILFGLFSLFVLFSLFNAIVVREPSIFEETRNQINKGFGKQMNADDKALLYSHYGKWSNSWVVVNEL